jgi:hypothetical protein
MSTIKSSDEHLTLNADGSSKDIKFQANGVEKASISSSGAFTSTTIDATKLTGDLPAISGANLTGVGVAGISSSADATAITINSSEQVGIGTASPSSELHIAKSANGGNTELILENTYNAGSSTDETVQIQGRFGGYDASYIITGKEEDWSDAATRSSYLALTTRKDGSLTERLRITGDGRGLSQFTAKAWINFAMDTGSIRDSHNVASITDNSTGNFSINFSNNLANSSYAASATAGNHAYNESHWDYVAHSYNYATNHFRVNVTNMDGALRDAKACSVILFGD